MPSGYAEYNSFEVGLLKEAVVKKYGSGVNSKTDCDKLSDLIEAETKLHLSVNTLRRFFNLIKSEGKPSLDTLNVLSKYCSFHDFYNFKHNAVIKPKPSDNLSISMVNDLYQKLGGSELFFNTFMNLTELSFYQENHQFLQHFFKADLFKDISAYPVKDTKRVINTLAISLRHNSNFSSTLLAEFAKDPKAQQLYFEWFVDYDYLNLSYHKAIELYSKEKKDNESQLFALSIMFFHKFLIEDKKGCELYIQKINAISFNQDFHPFPLGRRFACNILFEKFFRKKVSATLLKEVEYFASHIPKGSLFERDLPSFHLMVAEAFTFAGMYDQVLNMISIAKQRFTSEINDYTKGILIPLTIYQAQALAATGNKDAAHNLLSLCDVDTLDDHVKEFYRLHFLKVKQTISRNNHNELNSLSNSVEYLIKRHQFLSLSLK